MPASHLPSVEVLALPVSVGLLGQEVAGDDKDIPEKEICIYGAARTLQRPILGHNLSIKVRMHG
jgi:hypothetical protein